MKISEIKIKYENYIRLNYTSKDTKSSYCNCFWKFVNENDYIYRMSNQDIINYLLSFRERYSVSYHNQMLSSLKIIYVEILGQPNKLKGIKLLSQPDTLQNVMSVDQVRSAIASLENFKHRTILCVSYLCGVRISELINIELKHIDHKNLTLTIYKGKGDRDRRIPITDKLSVMILDYIDKYHPQVFLFEGPKGKYSKPSVRKICKKVGINNPHLLRHSIATHLIDKGDSVFHVAPFLGHKSIKSTQKYHHLSANSLRNLSIPNGE